MLKRVSVVAIAVSLVACASTTKPEASAQTVPVAAAPAVAPAPPAHPYALPPQPARAVVSAPSWFVKMPEDTADMMFSVGTATSTDEQMAYDKARMAAERKLVETLYSRIQTQTKSYRADRGEASIENFEQVTRKNARGELTGARRVDSQATFDGRVYKVYVLLRLPVGEANTLQRQRDQARLSREAEIRARAAQSDMDANEQRETDSQREADTQLRQDLQPQSRVTPVVVPTNSGEIKLLDVDNAEYKKRREEALQKPGAVVGQTVVR